MSPAVAEDTVKGAGRQILSREEQPTIMRGYSLPPVHNLDKNAAGYFVPIIERIDKDVGEMKGQVRALTEDAGALKMGFAEMKGEMKAMSERIDRNLAEYKAIASDFRSELKGDIGEIRGEISELRGDIKTINTRMNALEGKLSQNLVMTGLIVSVFGLIITAIQFLR